LTRRALLRISLIEPSSPGRQGGVRVLAWLERHQYLVLAVAALLLVAGLLVRDITREEPPTLVINDAPVAADGPVAVHVAGAVASPGVYELPAGARVQDAVLAAGGAASDADLDSLNLARRLRDGEKVTVPANRSPGASTPPTLAPGQTLDINHASQAQLDALPGIGEAYSRRIVDSRSVDGPYATVDDLVSRRVLPEATLAAIRDYLTVAP
jgi:competence protein ComEA